MGVTWGSQNAMPGDQVSNPLDAGVWGYCRSLHKEKPGQMLGVVDLPPINVPGCDDMHSAHAALIRLVHGNGFACGTTRAVAEVGEGMLEVALRGGQVYARRVANAFPAVAPGGSWSVACGGHQHVLVTGGTGGLGLLLAEWLAKVSRMRKVTLLSRSGTVTMFDVLDRLRSQAGVELEISLCDVSRPEEVSKVLHQSIDADAVFHLAGVNADGSVESQDALSIARCYSAKVRICISVWCVCSW